MELETKVKLRIFKVIGLCVLVAVFCLLAAPLSAQTPPPPPKKLMVFGDSLVAGYGIAYAEAFPAQLEAKLKADGYAIEVINAGVSGDTTSSGLTRLDWALAQKPDYFMLVLGGNDMLRQIDQKVTRANLDAIVTKVRAQKIPVLIAGMRAYHNLAGLGGGGLAGMYEDIADDHDALLYPFFLEGVAMNAAYNLDDGIHPNAQGVARIVEKIMPKVKALISG